MKAIKNTNSVKTVTPLTELNMNITSFKIALPKLIGRLLDKLQSGDNTCEDLEYSITFEMPASIWKDIELNYEWKFTESKMNLKTFAGAFRHTENAFEKICMTLSKHRTSFMIEEFELDSDYSTIYNYIFASEQFFEVKKLLNTNSNTDNKFMTIKADIGNLKKFLPVSLIVDASEGNALFTFDFTDLVRYNNVKIFSTANLNHLIDGYDDEDGSRYIKGYKITDEEPYSGLDNINLFTNGKPLEVFETFFNSLLQFN